MVGYTVVFEPLFYVVYMFSHSFGQGSSGSTNILEIARTHKQVSDISRVTGDELSNVIFTTRDH